MVGLYGMILCMVGFVAFGVVYFWPQVKVEVDSPKSPTSDIAIECQYALMPKAFPASGRIQTIMIGGRSGTKNLIGWGERYGSPNELIKEWLPGVPDLFAGRCSITNYGNKPVVNLQIFLAFDFYESIKTENGSTKSGDIKQKEDFVFNVPKVDVGSDHQELAERVMRERGLDMNDVQLKRTMGRRVGASLNHWKRVRGLVTSMPGPGQVNMWEIKR